jgi:hypothetical protein
MAEGFEGRHFIHFEGGISDPKSPRGQSRGQSIAYFHYTCPQLPSAEPPSHPE